MSDEKALCTRSGAPDEDTPPPRVCRDWLDEQGGAVGTRLGMRAAHSRAVRGDRRLPKRRQGASETSACTFSERAKKLAAEFEKEWFAGFPRREIDLGVLQPRVPHALFISIRRIAGIKSRPFLWFREPLLALELAGTVADLRIAHRKAGLDGVENRPRPCGHLVEDTVVGGVAEPRAAGLRKFSLSNEVLLSTGLPLSSPMAGSRTYAKSPSWGDFSAKAWWMNCWLLPQGRNWKI